MIFLLMAEGNMTDTVKGMTMRSGTKNPISIWEQNVLIIISVPGTKLFLKIPEVPTKAASHIMLGKDGWCPVP
jgi:hypothetical protein